MSFQNGEPAEHGDDDQQAGHVAGVVHDLTEVAKANAEAEKLRDKHGFVLGLVKAVLGFAGDILR
ncbi:hypothetical protein GCM10018781_02290 [Kitasatospora indigofera]|uniref:Uncharacterized protein n=1 Tax=Kitasatospora indigofera TaxID=67307 RepID=A0A919FBD0_9ACTN|nr:hypothetical protein [Kitasatospora indigofera]GHH59310.1 hypothetical protein GCM10018781_02290 [Kitasatospora indigofera]